MANWSGSVWGSQFPEGGGETPVPVEVEVQTYISENKHTAQLIAGSPVQTHVSGTGVVPAIADSDSHQAVGLMKETANSGQTKSVVTGGSLTLADWTAVAGTATLSKGLYFLSGTAGQITATAPIVGIVQPIGSGVASDTLMVEIEKPITL